MAAPATKHRWYSAMGEPLSTEELVRRRRHLLDDQRRRRDGELRRREEDLARALARNSRVKTSLDRAPAPVMREDDIPVQQAKQQYRDAVRQTPLVQPQQVRPLPQPRPIPSALPTSAGSPQQYYAPENGDFVLPKPPVRILPVEQHHHVHPLHAYPASVGTASSPGGPHRPAAASGPRSPLVTAQHPARGFPPTAQPQQHLQQPHQQQQQQQQRRPPSSPRTQPPSGSGLRQPALDPSAWQPRAESRIPPPQAAARARSPPAGPSASSPRGTSPTKRWPGIGQGSSDSPLLLFEDDRLSFEFQHLRDLHADRFEAQTERIAQEVQSAQELEKRNLREVQELLRKEDRRLTVVTSPRGETAYMLSPSKQVQPAPPSDDTVHAKKMRDAERKVRGISSLQAQLERAEDRDDDRLQALLERQAREPAARPRSAPAQQQQPAPRQQGGARSSRSPSFGTPPPSRPATSSPLSKSLRLHAHRKVEVRAPGPNQALEIGVRGGPEVGVFVDRLGGVRYLNDRLQAGDKIHMVGDHSCAGLSAPEVEQMIRQVGPQTILYVQYEPAEFQQCQEGDRRRSSRPRARTEAEAAASRQSSSSPTAVPRDVRLVKVVRHKNSLGFQVVSRYDAQGNTLCYVNELRPEIRYRKGYLQVGDELLEVNGVVLGVHSHRNISGMLKGHPMATLRVRFDAAFVPGSSPKKPVKSPLPARRSSPAAARSLDRPLLSETRSRSPAAPRAAAQPRATHSPPALQQPQQPQQQHERSANPHSRQQGSTPPAVPAARRTPSPAVVAGGRRVLVKKTAEGTFGIRLLDTHIAALRPAAQVVGHIAEGDRIAAVNGTPVRTKEDIQRLLQQSPREARLDVVEDPASFQAQIAAKKRLAERRIADEQQAELRRQREEDARLQREAEEREAAREAAAAAAQARRVAEAEAVASAAQAAEAASAKEARARARASQPAAAALESPDDSRVDDAAAALAVGGEATDRDVALKRLPDGTLGISLNTSADGVFIKSVKPTAQITAGSLQAGDQLVQASHTRLQGLTSKEIQKLLKKGKIIHLVVRGPAPALPREAEAAPGAAGAAALPSLPHPARPAAGGPGPKQMSTDSQPAFTGTMQPDDDGDDTSTLGSDEEGEGRAVGPGTGAATRSAGLDLGHAPGESLSDPAPPSAGASGDLSALNAADFATVVRNLGMFVQDEILKMPPSSLGSYYSAPRAPSTDAMVAAARTSLPDAAEFKGIAGATALRCACAAYPDRLVSREFLASQLGLCPDRVEARLTDTLRQRDDVEFWGAIMDHLQAVVLETARQQSGQDTASEQGQERRRRSRFRRSKGSRRDLQGSQSSLDSVLLIDSWGVGAGSRELAELFAPLVLAGATDVAVLRSVDSEERGLSRVQAISTENRLLALLRKGEADAEEDEEDEAPASILQSTMDLLTAPDLQLFRALLHISDTQPDLQDCLVLAFAAKDMCPPMITECIRHEVWTTDSDGNVLRGNTRSFRLLVTFARLVCADYLGHILKEAISIVQANPGNYQTNSRPGSGKMRKAEHNLADLIQSIINRLVSSAARAPPALRVLLFELRCAFSTKFPEHGERAVRSFFLLRFLGPALTKPAYYGIDTDGELSPASSLVLSTVNKIIVSIGNNQGFSESRNPHLVAFNPLVSANQATLSAFFDRLTVPASANDQAADFTRLREVATQEWSTNADGIVHFVRSHAETISQFLRQDLPQPEDRILAQAPTTFFNEVLLRRVLSQPRTLDPLAAKTVSKPKRSLLGRRSRSQIQIT